MSLLKGVPIVLLYLLTSFAYAQDIKPERKFWTNENKIITAFSIALKTTDAIETCKMLGQGYHERWLPTQNCAATTVFISSGQFASTYIQYLLWKRGHSKLSTIIPLINVTGSSFAIGYTFSHKR